MELPLPLGPVLGGYIFHWCSLQASQVFMQLTQRRLGANKVGASIGPLFLWMPPQSNKAGVRLEEAFCRLVICEVRMDGSRGHTTVNNAPDLLACLSFNSVFYL